VVALRDDGSVKWARQAGGRGSQTVGGLAVDEADPASSRTSMADEHGLLIATFTPPGELASMPRISTERFITSWGIACGPENRIYVLGDYLKFDDGAEPLDLDPGEGVFRLAGPDSGIFVLALDAAGGFIAAFLV
jgi:hypothetical protein